MKMANTSKGIIYYIKRKILSTITNDANVFVKFMVAAIIFILATIFAEYLFDIKEYVQDQGLVFENIEIFIIYLNLIVFYFFAKLIYLPARAISSFIYHKLFNKECDIGEIGELIASIVVSLIFIWYSSPWFASIIAAYDKNLLEETIFWWQFYILTINMLLNSGRLIEILKNGIRYCGRRNDQ
jgi:hypothetical protein